MRSYVANIYKQHGIIIKMENNRISCQNIDISIIKQSINNLTIYEMRTLLYQLIMIHVAKILNISNHTNLIYYYISKY